MPKFTKAFRVPGLLGVSNAARTETNVVSGRRIHMYIPPPPPPALEPSPRSAGEGLANKIHMEDAHGLPSPEAIPKDELPSSDPVAFEEVAYPSPRLKRTRSRNGRAGRPINNISINIQYRDPHGSQNYRPPSPPTSDIPIAVDSMGSDVHVQVDVQGIRQNYPARRTSLRKVLSILHLSLYFWNIHSFFLCRLVSQ